MWYRATLTSEQVADGHVDAISRLFAEAISGLTASEGACLFAASQDTRQVALGQGAEGEAGGEAYAVFFSPASISAVPHLIAQYRATPSGPPERDGAALLVGEPADWDLLPRSTH